MKIAEVMTQRPRAVTGQTTVREAARLMDEEDIGSLPVVDEGERLIGMLTDRDVATRDIAIGATVAAVAWQLLQTVGTYYVAHKLAGASEVYGAFAMKLVDAVRKHFDDSGVAPNSFHYEKFTTNVAAVAHEHA